MYGAIIGDIVGSVFEFNNIKTKNFPLFSEASTFTDDTIMTIAVAQALLKAKKERFSFKHHLINEMRRMGRRFPNPTGGYGDNFARWLNSSNPKPYNSFGNGSAMRVSPCGLIAINLDEARELAKASAEITHNHPEGIKGAQTVASAIWLAKTGKSKELIKILTQEYYPLDKSLEEIRSENDFDESCQNTVPQAITAFLESTDYDDAIRNAVSIGGDSDTIAAITGSIAWAFYKNPKNLNKNDARISYISRGYELSINMEQDKVNANEILPYDFIQTIELFEKCCLKRIPHNYDKDGFSFSIPVDKWSSVFDNDHTPIVSFGNKPLLERLRECYSDIGDDFDKQWLKCLFDLGLIVVNYKDYFNLYFDRIFNGALIASDLSLEECFICLSIIQRSDYWEGGGTLEKHNDIINGLVHRIMEILNAIE